MTAMPSKSPNHGLACIATVPFRGAPLRPSAELQYQGIAAPSKGTTAAMSPWPVGEPPGLQAHGLRTSPKRWSAGRRVTGSELTT